MSDTMAAVLRESGKEFFFLSGGQLTFENGEKVPTEKIFHNAAQAEAYLEAHGVENEVKEVS